MKLHSITVIQWCEVKSVDRDTEIAPSLWSMARRRYVMWPRTTISSRALTQLIFFVQCSFGRAWLHPRRLSTLFQIHLNSLPIGLPLDSLLAFIIPSLPPACSWSRSCPVSLELNILTILHEKIIAAATACCNILTALPGMAYGGIALWFKVDCQSPMSSSNTDKTGSR